MRDLETLTPGSRGRLPQGVRVATVTILGGIAPNGSLAPADIADEYWRLHAAALGPWRREVFFPRPGRPLATLDDQVAP